MFPSDQITVPLIQFAVNVVVSGPHNTNLPGVTVGATGTFLCSIVTGVESGDAPHSLVQVAV